MEPQTFDLQRSVTDFIQRIRFTGGLTESDVSELATHLFDSVEGLRASGLSEEEAFLIATHRLGPTDEISREYRKVNPGLLTDRIWAYMLLGFSLLTTLGWFYTRGYLLTMHFADLHPYGAFLCIGFNLLVSAFVWSVLFWGRRFSAWIQRTTERRPWLTVLMSLGPVALLFVGRVAEPYALLDFKPEYTLWLVLITRHLSIVSMAVVLVLSVFSISLPGHMTFRNVFGRLTVPYILLFGFIIEVIAALTREWQSIPTAVALFGVVYAAGAFCVAYFRERGQVLRALLFYALPGLVAEIWAGSLADADRGGTHYTVYFAAALLAGVTVGSLSARVMAKFRESAGVLS